MATKPAEETPSAETLKYQTWVLKVLIHCDGCTKRVKKLLHGIEGVYRTEIDSGQHKVTVTGNVDAETLIKKLSRSGKSVELWPEKPAEKKDNNKSGKSKSTTEDINVKKENQKINISTEPVTGEGSGSNEVGNGSEEGDDECDGGAGGNGGGEGSKKKKKKKKKNKGAENGGGKVINNTDPHSTVNASSPVPSKEVIISPPVQQAYPYPPQIYYSHPPPPPIQPPPPYGLSYNTSYPISSASNYYVGAPVMPMHAYTNPYSRLPPPPPPSYPINHYLHDEDEYQGGYSYCSIM